MIAMSGRWLPSLGKTELDSAGEPLGVGALVAEEGQGEVESFDLTVPSLGLGLLPAADQVGFYLVEAGEHSGVYAQDGTPDDPCSCWQGVP